MMEELHGSTSKLREGAGGLGLNITMNKFTLHGDGHEEFIEKI